MADTAGLSVADTLLKVDRQITAVSESITATSYMPKQSCPDCKMDMQLKRADEDVADLVYWECPRCLKSIYEGKTMQQLIKELS